MEARSKLEQQLVNDLLRVLKNQAKQYKIPFDYFQIESGATAIGIPDLFVMLGDKGMWIECKRLQTDRNLEVGINSARVINFEGSVVFRPGQARMMNKLVAHGEQVGLCVLSEYGDIWLHRWGTDEHDYQAETARYFIHSKKAVYQTYALDMFATALGITLPRLAEVTEY